MLDQQHRHVGRQGRHGLQQLLALAGRHAGHRLVEQQHARLAGQRDRDLEQAALAVGQLPRLLLRNVAQMELLEQLRSPLRHLGRRAQRPPPLRGQPGLLRDHERQRFQRRHRVEELVDLEGAHHAARHAAVRRQARDVLAFQHDAAGRRREHTRQEVDQRGLAGAVGPDQCVARAALQVQRHVVGGRDAAEAHHEAGGRENDVVHGLALRRAPNQVQGFNKRSRPTSTSSTRISPIQNIQYCGVTAESQFCSSLNTIAPVTPP